MLGSLWGGRSSLLLYELNYPWDRCNLIPLKPTIWRALFHSIRLHSAVAAVISHQHGCSAEGRYKLHTCTHSTIYMIYYLTSYIEYKGMFLELRALLCLFVFCSKIKQFYKSSNFTLDLVFIKERCSFPQQPYSTSVLSCMHLPAHLTLTAVAACLLTCVSDLYIGIVGIVVIKINRCAVLRPVR